jgi:cell division protein FtsW (lipid II flippase)/cell division protein FtsI/penicillin-binding protein 2
MRVIEAAPSRVRRPITAAARRTARLERLGLTVTSVVFAAGLALTYGGQTSEFAAIRGQLSTRRVVNVSASATPDALAGPLGAIDDPVRRAAIANAIAQIEKPLTHLGALVPNVVTGAELAAIKPSLIVRTPSAFRREVLMLAALFLAAFWAAHVVRALAGTTGDPVLLPALQLLSGIGVQTMIALRDPLRDTVSAAPFAGGVAAGCALFAALSLVDFEQPRLRRAVLAPLAAAVLLAVSLLVFGNGPTGSGVKVNLLGAQPVEAIRLLVVFALAAYFARRWQFLRELSQVVVARGSMRLHLPRWTDVRPLLVIVGTVVALFFLQKDLGPALVLCCLALGLYGVARRRAALVVGGFAMVVGAFVTGYVLGIPATVTRRVAIWLDPWSNGVPGGDQVSHALWALASGGRWGAGPGFGDPQFIPAGHTDLVIAAVGEELGFIGVLCIAALFALVTWRMLRAAVRAPGDYTSLLALGLCLGLGVQAIVICAGMLGLMPLTGVVTPFLSFGRSAMISNFIAVAIAAAIARRAGRPRLAFAAPTRTVGVALTAAGLVIVGRVAVIQVIAADDLAARGNLAHQADGEYRFQYNPRLIAAARTIVRGTIYDRNGLPLATSRPDELRPFAKEFAQIGAPAPQCTAETPRCYPLGGLAYHVLGDAVTETNWAARNTSFVERELDARLKGFDDHARVVEVTRAGMPPIRAVTHDYGALRPLIRHRSNPQAADVRRLVDATRTVRVTLDARLQAAVARALAAAAKNGSGRAAAIVLDADTDELLAAASYPWPELPDADSGRARAARDHAARSVRDQPNDDAALLDRARYGLYPPGSTFKIVTAAAAFRAGTLRSQPTVQCVRLPDGRVGARLPGVATAIRDDEEDHTPHGTVDLRRAFVVSCNAYFASLAEHVGARALADTAAAAQVSAAAPPVQRNLARTLPYAGYGQGQVVASPLRMARIAAAVANGGMLRDVSTTLEPAPPPTSAQRWISADASRLLGDYMREAVTSGTGRVLAGNPVPIAGKTGTAEIPDAKSHSWFVGFAPYRGGGRRIAFAVVVENAGYGARAAAPVAGQIVAAAKAAGVIR